MKSRRLRAPALSFLLASHWKTLVFAFGGLQEYRTENGSINPAASRLPVFLCFQVLHDVRHSSKSGIVIMIMRIAAFIEIEDA